MISAGCALLLLVIMFALEWYGAVGLPHGAERSGITSAANAWQELTGLRWLMLLTVLVALGAVILHITQRSHGAQTDTGLAVTGLGALSAILLANRVLVDLPAPSSVVDAKLGAYLGVLATIGIVIGGYQSIREESARNALLSSERRIGSALPSPTSSR